MLKRILKDNKLTRVKLFVNRLVNDEYKSKAHEKGFGHFKVKSFLFAIVQANDFELLTLLIQKAESSKIPNHLSYHLEEVLRDTIDSEQFDMSEKLVTFFPDRKDMFVSIVAHKLFVYAQRKLTIINPTYFTLLEKIIGDHRPKTTHEILALLYKAQQKNLLTIYWKNASDMMQIEALMDIRKMGVTQDLINDPLLKDLPDITDRIKRCDLLMPTESNINVGKRERVESVLPPHASDAKKSRMIAPTVANTNKGPGFFSSGSSTLPINPATSSSTESTKKRNIDEMTKEELVVDFKKLFQICKTQKHKITQLEEQVKELQDKLSSETNSILTTVVAEHKGMTR